MEILMGRRRFRIRSSRASSSMKTLECPLCHSKVPLNEYRSHIIQCREKSSNESLSPESTEPETPSPESTEPETEKKTDKDTDE